MLIAHIYWILAIWIATLLIGFVSLPISRLIFTFSKDKGYAFSKIFGWFALGYITFLLATFKLVPLAIPALTVALIVWIALNAYLFLKDPASATPKLKHVATSEIIFLLVLCGLVFIKGFQPEIYQIERFMDFGFLETLGNSTFLPIQDLWLAGTTLNYYYFGHFIGFVILSLTGISNVPGFFLLTSSIFALLATGIFRFASDVTSLFVQVREKFRFDTMVAGLLSVFGVLFAGTWYMIPWLLKKMVFFLGSRADPTFSYPEPTRVIPGTITEMPIYSFLVSDIHAHVWGMLSGILILAILYSLWRDEEVKLNVQNPYIWPLAFVLGAAYMINSWDALSLGVLSVAILATKYWKSGWTHVLIYSSLLAIVAYAIALPWSIFQKLPISGIGVVHNQSPFWLWLSFWGSALTVVLVYHIWQKKKLSFPGVVMAVAIFWLVLVEFFYLKDILVDGEWFRANTVFKISTQSWLWINIFMGPTFIWLYRSIKKPPSRHLCVVILLLYLTIGLIYPIIAIFQSTLVGKSFTGIDSGLSWWQEKYPDDYEAYLFLRDIKNGFPKSEKIKRIVEAEGESYTDISRFSVFLGWPTIIGWPTHEWTWRGDENLVEEKRKQVKEIYTGESLDKTKAILDVYNIDYVIVGQIERGSYAEQIEENKLRALGEVIFENNETFIVKYNK